MAGDDVLNPPSRTVSFRGASLKVHPLRLEQLGPFITACRATIGRLAMIAGLPEGSAVVEVGSLVFDLLENGSTEVAEALAVAVDKETQWVAAGSLDEVAELLEAVVGLNKDFFARRLRAMVAMVREAASPPTSPTLSST